MTGQELREARERLGIGVADLGVALGYRGSLSSAARTIRRYEDGRAIPDYLADVVRWFEQHGIPAQTELHWPRVCDGYLLHGDKLATAAYAAMGSRRHGWLPDWYFNSGSEYRKFELRRPLSARVPYSGMVAPVSCTIAAIAAHDPIITGRVGDHWNSTLLGARLSVTASAGPLAAWLRERQKDAAA